MSNNGPLIRIAAMLAAIACVWPGSVDAQPAPSPAAIVQSVLAVPDDRLDYARAKLAFDRIVDPSLNVETTLAEIDRLARGANALAGPGGVPPTKPVAPRPGGY